MAVDADNLKALLQAISAAQKLRESVNKTFSSLHDGKSNDDDAIETKVKPFVTQLQLNLCTVNDNFSELEKLTNIIVKLNQGCLGVTGVLSLDPVLDKTPLYQQVLQSYKWSSKLKEHSSHASSLLAHHFTMKRSSSIAGKKRKIHPNLLAISPQTVEQMVSTLNRQCMDIMVIGKVPNIPNVYQVTLGRTFHAIVGLRRIVIERVIIRGQHENINLDDRLVDIWTPSKYKVFQKLTDHATSAMLHYHLPLRADMCFVSFMRWLQSYQKLFSTPCRHCGQFLMDNLPPTWHDFRTLSPYHEVCRQ